MIDELKKELILLSDEKYKKFSSSLLPNVDNILGVRLPTLRKIAKKIAKSNYKDFLIQNDNSFAELTLIEAMVIGLIKDENEAFELAENFISKITNWSICDTFCASFKFFSKNKTKTMKLLEKYLNSKNEFESRFCFVVLLMYFIEDDYVYVFDCLKNFNNNAYYAKMAAAWCLSYCLIKKFDTCILDIQKNNIMPWVARKGVTKALESYRLNEIQKKKLIEFRKKIKN